MTTAIETKAPGIHLLETKTPGPIAGAGTSTAALIGKVEKEGVTPDKPVLVTNWTQYTQNFGELQGLSLPHALRGFFRNGGNLAYVVPVDDASGTDGITGALDALTRVPDVSIVCVPGVTDTAKQKEVIEHCEVMGDRFAILDGPRVPGPTDEPTDEPTPPSNPLEAVKAQQPALTTERGFGALYWPWIVTDDPEAAAGEAATLPVAPSGHIAGVMARSDNERGVHKAPANEVVRGALALQYNLNDKEQSVLNNLGINALRTFPGGPPVVWGARTLTTQTPWRYVNVRRLVAYISDSLLQGLHWAVFEPNNTALWKALERTVIEFLTRVWQAGALFGRTAAEAFYVKIDDELNPEPVRALGQVFIEIGLAPTRPAEHVVVRLGLWSGGGSAQEA
ncbi:phage tail sheath family protein [Streptomyces afghaniensis]|uniref:phage tail sheath family protein n=1 Tax=Streptomyces TaxID=1883 RepID=UPI001FAE7E65|nr:phage tail sheath subtilisin-like domain-containing protein [Streptomyces sp. HP-A2021]UOB15382.1 phage tail sheath subtilisin-like domain-containing protein [Streptomyces sp. HP-A2021]